MKKALILVVLLVIIGGGFWFSKGGSTGHSVSLLAVKYAEPTDAVDDFYHQWLKATKDSSAVPNRTTLTTSSALSKELGTKLATAIQSGASVDPVLCQSVVPQEIVIRNVYEQTDKAQLVVTSKDKSVTKQAVVNLNKSGDSWVISEIKCTNGEFAPEREFTFEQEGFLIKTSVPKPYNNKNWHLVFERDGKAGNVVPLLFDAKSQCTSLVGVKAVCKPDKFTETSKVKVYGQMTERGASVVRLEFVK